jgi:uncharacterized membrane protein YfcA
VAGAFIGAKIAGSLPAHVLRKLFAVFLIVVAVKMLFFSPVRKPLSPEVPHLSPQENNEKR